MVGLSPEELRELRRLHVQAGRRVDALFAGDWRSAVRGRGMEFEEVRPYHPGDDVRHIDWNVTARSGAPHVKVFREERQLTVLLVVDVSGSTLVGTGGRDGRTDRRLQMARIAGGIAYAGVRNRDQVGLVTFTDRIEAYLSPRPTRGHIWNVIQHVYEVPGRHGGTDIASALSFVGQVQRRRAVILVVSDFLDPGDWPRSVRVLARRHELHAVLVHDPLDRGLSGLGLVDVLDAETGERKLVDTSVWRPSGSVDERVRRLRRAGARAVSVSTMEDPYSVLHRHFHEMRRSR